ncbi:hypothetical protein Tco_1214379 [Tanacetum coccineum]
MLGNPNNRTGEEQLCVIALVVDVDEDIAMLFSDDDFEDDDSEGFDEEEVWEVNEEWLMAPVTPPPMQAVPLPSVYELVKKVIQVSDAEVAAGISIGEIGLRIFAIEGGHTGNPTCVDWWIDVAHDPRAPNDYLGIGQD